MKHKSNRTKIKIYFFIARIVRFLRPTSGTMCKLMWKTYLDSFCYGKSFLVFFFFFLPIRLGVLRFNSISLALVPARKQFIDENKLTFMKPLDESLNNQSYGRNGGFSLKTSFHILSRKLNRKYKYFWCFTWLSLVEIAVSNFALIRPKIVFLPEINCWKLEYLAQLTTNRYEYFRNFFSLEMNICWWYNTKRWP